MKLLLKASGSDEWTNEGDHILVPLTEETVKVMAKRIHLCSHAYAMDDDTHKICFWDFSPDLLTLSKGEIDEMMDKDSLEALERDEMVMLGDDFEVPDDDLIERKDLCQMVVARCGDDYEIEWTMNLKHTSVIYASRCVSLEWIKAHIPKGSPQQITLDGIVDEMMKEAT
jgi:hypothetical protein